MIELCVQGTDPRQRLRCRLETSSSVVLGRGSECDIPVPWDRCISRRHLQIAVSEQSVTVSVLPEAVNEMFIQGAAVKEARVDVGGQFVIGSTTFLVTESDSDSASSGRPVEEVTFNRRDLEKVHFRDADKRIEVLSRLPDVIGSSQSDSDLHHRLVGLLLAGVAHADAVAVVSIDDDEQVDVLHWDRRRETEGAFRPSARLVTEAITKRRRSVLHVWESAGTGDTDYTVMVEFDWAFCTPILEQSSLRWGLYVAGRMGSEPSRENAMGIDVVQLQADVKFTELVTDIVSSVRRVNTLERQRSSWRQFFAPTVLEALGEDFDSDLLDPRECDVTVMFCDLRGFSQQAEDAADDLLGLLDRVSLALGVMTREIRRYGGVTGDFQGDSTLGFWGWPIDSEESALDACRAALAIRQSFTETFGESGHPLEDFQMGIGLAHGRAVAGKIGTADQVKVTVFGPVVNLASRLEGMTRQLRVPILLDEVMAETVRRRMRPDEGRVRQLARVLPYGLEVPVLISELLPPESQFPELSNAHISAFERGVEQFIEGNWEEAYQLLHDVPAADRAQDFLAMRIAQHGRTAPADWDGIIRLPTK